MNYSPSWVGVVARELLGGKSMGNHQGMFVMQSFVETKLLDGMCLLAVSLLLGRSKM